MANADRFIPYQDQSVSLILSITARQHAPEFYRLLRRSGRALIALPAPEDLAEIRGLGRDRVPRLRSDFEQGFRVLEQRRVTTTAELTAAMVEDVRLSIYRPLTSKPLETMRVTLSLDLLLFERL